MKAFMCSDAGSRAYGLEFRAWGLGIKGLGYRASNCRLEDLGFIAWYFFASKPKRLPWRRAGCDKFFKQWLMLSTDFHAAL